MSSAIYAFAAVGLVVMAIAVPLGLIFVIDRWTARKDRHP